MYFSRLMLNPRSRQVQREVGNPYQLHRTIMDAFPEILPEQERVLYRLDIEPDTGQLLLLVQSQFAPDWSFLTENDYLLSVNPFSDLANPATKFLSLTLKKEQCLFFRLRANPTKRLCQADPERKLKAGQRIGLLKEADQLTWLNRKGEDGGFKILEVRIAPEGFRRGYIPHRRGGEPGEPGEPHRFNHFAVRFDGLLQVTEVDTFQKTLRDGIGRGKGLGFGLLSIASAQ